MKETCSFLSRFWNDESGASSAEYAVILAVIGSAVALSVFVLSGAIATGINNSATCLNTMGDTCN